MSLPPEIARYLAVGLGLLLGTLGKYGLLVTDHKAIRRGDVVGHLLMLGVLFLVAEGSLDIVTMFGVELPGLARALAGAGSALSGDRVVRRFRSWYGDAVDRRFPVSDERGSE